MPTVLGAELCSCGEESFASLGSNVSHSEDPCFSPKRHLPRAPVPETGSRKLQFGTQSPSIAFRNVQHLSSSGSEPHHLSTLVWPIFDHHATGTMRQSLMMYHVVRIKLRLIGAKHTGHTAW